MKYDPIKLFQFQKKGKDKVKYQEEEGLNCQLSPIYFMQRKTSVDCVIETNEEL